jgi:hypothetical protein
MAFALAHPGLGRGRIAAELAREKWGGLQSQGTASGAGCGAWASTPAPSAWRLSSPRCTLTSKSPRLSPPERRIEAHESGEKVQLDCFYVGRLQDTKGTVWQYSAIDVVSSYDWAAADLRAQS